MLWDEAGAHVSGLERRVARETQQKVNVSVQAHDLQTGGARPRSPEATGVRPYHPGRAQRVELGLTLYWRKQ